MTRSISPNWLAPPNLRAGSEAQRAIADAAELGDRIGPVETIAGVDTSMKWRDMRGPIHAAVAPIGWPGGAPLPAHSLTMVPAIPYVPGYLGFRETPALLAVLDRMAERPDLILVDGHGIAHPRRCGIATHLGVVADLPTIGCAKTLLCGRIEGALGPSPGDTAPLVDRGEQVGVALRMRSRSNPIYISTGHRVSLETAVAWVMKLGDGRRLPEAPHAIAVRRAVEVHVGGELVGQPADLATAHGVGLASERKRAAAGLADAARGEMAIEDGIDLVSAGRRLVHALGIQGQRALRGGKPAEEALDVQGIDPGVAPDGPVLHGGPVEPSRGFVLHSRDWGGAGTIDVHPLCGLSASLDILRAIAEGRGPRHWLIALGYASWAPGQLEGEMRRHGWFAADGSSDILFDTPVGARWAATWRIHGIDPALLASETGSA